ncbi:MAG: hypothetical protein SCG72_03935 [Nitrosarchaeum sp.]|jgi:hypothetical protein|nr:hypothetical protein [Nitrosarchaeum sp.]
MKIIHQNCEQSLSNDKSLPNNSYLVGYIIEDVQSYDIVQSSSRVEVFDYYYDLCKNVVSIDWTNGKTNPKFYGYTKPEGKKKR